MRILVIGSGGREHALCWKIAQSTKCSKLYCAPGNGGIQEVAETFVIYNVDAPTDDARRLAAILSAQAFQLNEAIGKLETLKGIQPHLKEIHELENEADGLSRAAVARLFRDSPDPLNVIKWRDIYIALENTIDAAEDAGEVIERVIAKSS